MKSERILSDLYQCYAGGDLPKKDFEGEIFQYLLSSFPRYRKLEGDKHRWNEFLSWLYPRLARAVDLYREIGSCFDAYITTLVYRSYREYRSREADHRITEYTCWQARAIEMNVCESEIEYDAPQFEGDVRIPAGVKPRQVLLLLLKSYYFVTEEFVSRISCAIGMKTETVMAMVDELKKRRLERELKVLSLRDRIHCQHYRCLAYQQRMNAAQEGTDYRKKMDGRYGRARQRLAAMKKRLGKMRLDASNRMIADVMGIPKGTVDSGLFAVKHFMANLQQKTEGREQGKESSEQ